MTETSRRNLPQIPFPGIDSYESADAAIFFSRDADVKNLVRLVVINRGVLLYSPSGTGKSSLIKAGLVPSIIDMDYLPLEVRVQPEEGKEISLRILERTISEHANTEIAQGSVSRDRNRLVFSVHQFEENLKRRARTEHILLILDQFEEWITLFRGQSAADPEATRRAQQSIQDLILRLMHQRDLRVKLIFSFREDYLADLMQLFNQCPQLSDCYLRLGNLEPLEVRETIVAPFQKFPGFYQPELDEKLARRIVDELIERRGGEAVDLTEVQIVCRSLWEAGSRPADTFKRVGGVQGLIERYLEQAIESLAKERQEPAVALLRYLVTKHGTRNVVSRDFLLDVVAKEIAIGHDELGHTLDDLDRQARLVRRERQRRQDSEYTEYYEIRSEFLVPWIQRRVASHEQLQERLKTQKRIRQLTVSVMVLASVLALTVTLAFVYSAAQRHERAAKGEKTLSEIREKQQQIQRIAGAAKEGRVTPDDLEELVESHESVFTKDKIWRDLALASEGREEIDPEATRKYFGLQLENALRNTIPAITDKQELGNLPDGTDPGSLTMTQGGILFGAFPSTGLWEWKVGQPIEELRGLPGSSSTEAAIDPYARISATPQGLQVAAIHKDGRLSLWRRGGEDDEYEKIFQANVNHWFDAASDQAEDPSPPLRFITLAQENIAISRDDGWLLSIKIEDLVEGTGPQITAMNHFEEKGGRRRWIHAGAFDASESLLVSAGADRVLRLWPVKRGAKKRTNGSPSGINTRKIRAVETSYVEKSSIFRVEWVNDRRLVGVTYDKVATVWRRSKDGLKPVSVLSGHEELISDIAVSPNGSWVVTACLDGSLRLWDVESGMKMKTWRHPAFGPWARVFWTQVDEGEMVVAIGHDSSVWSLQVPNPESGSELARLSGPLNIIEPSRDGRWILAIGDGEGDGEIQVHKRSGSGTESPGALRNKHRAPVRGVSWCPDFPVFVTAGGSAIKSWRLEESDGENFRVVDQKKDWRISKGKVRVDCNESGDALVYIDGTETAWFRSLESDSARPIEVAKNVVRAVFSSYRTQGEETSPDSRPPRILTGGKDGLVRLWTTETSGESGKTSFRQLNAFSALTAPIYSLAESAEGGWVAAGTTSGFLAIWQARDGRLVNLQSLHRSAVSAVDFDDSGKFLIAAGGKAVHAWRIDPWELVSTHYHSANVRDAAFTVQPRSILSGGSDRKLKGYDSLLRQSLEELVENAERIIGQEPRPQEPVANPG